MPKEDPLVSGVEEAGGAGEKAGEKLDQLNKCQM